MDPRPRRRFIRGRPSRSGAPRSAERARSPLVALLAALGIGWSGDAASQAWVQPVDSYYVKFSASYLSTQEEFDAEGNRQEIFADDPSRSDGSFRDITFTAYAEYGFKPFLTAVARLPFKVLTSTQTVAEAPGFPSVRSETTNGGFGDLLVSLRTPIVRHPFALAFQGGVKLPTGYEPDPDNGGPALGSGEIDIEGHLTWGLSLYPIRAYVSAGAGYRLRGGPLHDEVLYNAEAGYTLERLFLKVRLDGIENTAGVDADLAPETRSETVADIVVGDQDIWKLNAEAAYAVTGRAWLNGEIFHTFAGRATVAGTTVSIGLVLTH